MRGNAQSGVEDNPRPLVLLTSGFAAGICVAGVLNPVDRALYLSIAKRRSFLDALNWRHPFLGVWQSLFGRAVSSGLWFPLERLAAQKTKDAELPPGVAAAVAGQLAGIANAVVLAPFSFVKFQTWGLPDGKRSFLRTARMIRKRAGAKVFFRGLPATVMRDALFGGIFSGMRQSLRSRAVVRKYTGTQYLNAAHICADFVAAGVATTVSSPLNYARNMQFGCSLKEPAPTTLAVLVQLRRETPRGFAGGSLFLLQRMKVGWGTLRVAGGMALAAKIFSSLVALGGASAGG